MLQPTLTRPHNLLTIDTDGQANQWDIGTDWKPHGSMATCGPGLLAADSCNGLLATGGSCGSLVLSHTASPQPVAVINTVDIVQSCSFVKSMPFAIATGSLTSLRLFDLRMHRCYRTVSLAETTSLPADDDVEQPLESCETFCFNSRE